LDWSNQSDCGWVGWVSKGGALFEAFFSRQITIGNAVSAIGQERIGRRVVDGNVWLGHAGQNGTELLAAIAPQTLKYEVLPSEEAVGAAMLDEIEAAARAKEGSLVVIILGGRGAQALHRLLGNFARSDEKDWLLKRLHIFTQDALAPLRMDNGLSFVRDFERLLGEDFFRKVLSFNSIKTDSEDLEAELARYAERLESLGGKLDADADSGDV
jgi:hypothetical protein